eukprot:CAMPEP_0119361362 /NCGR_PEP_ID=MMETSP1334-20130426/8688_1 /TAXON_ID=127549 /ORGANISM="Calcidiscus leptoporus, Strain RCC1130" /LENGTH=287 /DNA_ID=CAMNT_0007376355 /DNA_START=66 /DNA_END=929 /DNA_ORIENTATION=-
MSLDKQPLSIPRQSLVTERASTDSSGVRSTDGRTVDQTRMVQMRVGVLAKAAGSACVEFQNTRVLCSIAGPTQTEGKEYLSRANLECSLRFTSFAQRSRRRGVLGSAADERALSSALRTALVASVQLDQYPKSVIAVNVLVIQDDGGALAAALMCASLALAHAGLLMYDLVAASSCAILDGSIVLDPSASELRVSTGQVTIGHMCSLQQVTLLHVDAAIPFERMTEVLQLVLEGCAKLHTRMRAILTDSSTVERNSDASASQQMALDEQVPAEKRQRGVSKATDVHV